MRKVSQKKAAQNKEYRELRGQFLWENPYCQCKAEGCTHKATDIHHKKGRGTHTLNTLFWMVVCRMCHIKITENPTWAKENGFEISRL